MAAEETETHGMAAEETENHGAAAEKGGASRKERRKAAKKGKRKQKRREIAEKEKAAEEARINDPEERRRVEIEEERERERVERERAEFEERERAFLLELAEKKRKEEEREREAEEEFSKLNQVPHEDENESDCEYIEDGPPEIIWQGNEIIVKKKKIKVKRKDADQQLNIEESGRPTSNPFPPESEPFADSKSGSVVSAQQVLDNAAHQIPNFGTEHDKAHCPFQIKTGACRFGLRCSRLHFYPDKSCTLLIKNMYNGPGLTFEQDEGLELQNHTDEEVDRCFEEFYEDVHTEFLKFGEIVNFKVCKNSSFHLRGNLYVHYKSQDSAMLAYQSVNGRYFAGKQVTCEFVGVTKWRVAICGEFMRSRLKTCSRGTACNFIHCFRNPGGDYEWADWDKPPPKYWVQEMAALFGTSQHSSEMTSDRNNRHLSKRSQSRERKSSRDHRHDEYDSRRSRHYKLNPSHNRKDIEYHRIGNWVHDSDSDKDQSNRERGEDRYHDNTKESVSVNDNKDYHEFRTRRSESDAYWSDIDRKRNKKRNQDRDRDRKRDEDMHYRPNGRSSTPKRTNTDKWYDDDDVELMVEDRDRKRDEDVHYKPKRKSSTSKRKSRDSVDDSEFIVKDNDRERDEDMHYNQKRKRRDKWDSVDDSESMLEDNDRERDEDMHYNPKRKSRDRWNSADDSEVMLEDKDRKRNEDVHYNSKGKKSTPKRKSRDRWDSADDRELMLEDKSNRHKRSRKTSRHLNEERDFIEGVERRGRWDDKLGV